MSPLSTVTLTLPEAWQFSVETLLGGLLALVVGVWMARAAYSSVMGAIATLSRDVDTMRASNTEEKTRREKNADKVTEIEKNVAIVVTQVEEMNKKLDLLFSLLNKPETK